VIGATSSAPPTVTLPSDEEILITRRFDAPSTAKYREIVPNERIVTTEVFEMPGADPPALEVVTFAEADGRTTLELLIWCQSRELRDMILESGMETGMQEQMEVLEEVARSLR
jgi:uncharacterized protein YndB with AHSA1/START domain